MSHLKYIVIVLTIPCFLQGSEQKKQSNYLINKSSKQNKQASHSIDKKNEWGNLAGLFTAGVVSSVNKIGKIPLNSITRPLLIVPSFFVGKEVFTFTLNSAQKMNHFIKITKK